VGGLSARPEFYHNSIDGEAGWMAANWINRYEPQVYPVSATPTPTSASCATQR